MNSTSLPLTPHLTEDELDEILIADGKVAQALTDDRAAHFFACAACRARHEDFSNSLETFNQASMAWSEARSNTLNRDLSQAAARQRHSFSFADFGALAAALLMVVAMVATHTPRQPSSAPSAASPEQARQTTAQNPNQIAAPLAAPASSPRLAQAKPAHVLPVSLHATQPVNGEIDNDNAMLLAIDSALSTPEPSPAELYRPTEAVPLSSNQFDDDRVND